MTRRRAEANMRAVSSRVVFTRAGRSSGVAGVLGRLILTCGAVVSLAVGSVEAQGVRGWATTTGRFVELPILSPASSARLAPTSPGRAWSGLQDLSLTAWGLGMRGLSFTSLLRGRVDSGDEIGWPRADDRLDVMLLFAQLERAGWRVRLGRQENASGLGFTAYDGASVGVALHSLGAGARIEAFGGRSLARGLSEPRHEALRGFESFVPDRNAWLVGGAFSGRLAGSTSVGLRYQREIWSDRSGLVSERASLDIRSLALAPVRVTGSADWDFAFGRVGKAHVTASWAPSSTVLAELSARRYVPYFELSTIWGFFDPVPYHEVGLRVSASPRPALGVWASGAARRYGASDSPVFLSALEDRGWRGEVGATWGASRDVSVSSTYEIDWLPGAFLSGANARVSWSASPDVRLDVTGVTFQRFEEFRLGDGRAIGGGLSGVAQVTERVGVSGGVLRYRLWDADPAGGPSIDAWSQDRGWLSLRVALGRDPGLRGRVLGGRVP